MKNLYVLIVITLISCARNIKEKETSVAQPLDTSELQDTTELESSSEVIEAKSLNKTIDTLTTESALLDKVLEQLNLKHSRVNMDLLVTKVMPNNTQETIMAIPEFVETETVDYDFKCNSHIIIVNSETGRITHTYFESSKTNGWVSDAIQLLEIKIDTAPYVLAENTRAFGIRVLYYGSSQPNPYSNETLSLFVKSDDSLKKVLNNYEVMDYGGEWDMSCTGEFIKQTKTLGTTTKKTNGYFDIWVNTKLTETISYEDENGECESSDTVSKVKSQLKFDGKRYKEATDEH